jgi:hypothetical protein
MVGSTDCTAVDQLPIVMLFQIVNVNFDICDIREGPLRQHKKMIPFSDFLFYQRYKKILNPAAGLCYVPGYFFAAKA